MNLLIKRLSDLLCVKSIVTIALTVVFGYLSILNRISGQEFLTIFSIVIAFYFGTQSQRVNRSSADSKQEQDKV